MHTRNVCFIHANVCYNDTAFSLCDGSREEAGERQMLFSFLLFWYKLLRVFTFASMVMGECHVFYTIRTGCDD